MIPQKPKFKNYILINDLNNRYVYNDVGEIISIDLSNSTLHILIPSWLSNNDLLKLVDAQKNKKITMCVRTGFYVAQYPEFYFSVNIVDAFIYQDNVIQLKLDKIQYIMNNRIHFPSFKIQSLDMDTAEILKIDDIILLSPDKLFQKICLAGDNYFNPHKEYGHRFGSLSNEILCLL
jgi:hypothetical protein